MKKIYLLAALLSTNVFAQPTVQIVPVHKECICNKRCELIVNYSVNVPNDTDSAQNIEIHYVIRGVGTNVKEYKRIIRKFNVEPHSVFSENYINRLNVTFDDSHNVRHYTYGGIDINTNGVHTFDAYKEENIYIHDKN
jgi:uncharacterized protein YxeA